MANIDPVGTPVEGLDPVGTNAGTEAGSTTAGAGIRGWLSTLAGIFQTVGAKVQGLGVAGTPSGGVVSVQYPNTVAVTQVDGVFLVNVLNQVTNQVTASAPYVFAPGSGGGQMSVMRTPTVWKSFSALAIGSETTIWDPATKLFRLMGYVIAQGTLAGAITLKDGTGGTTRLIIPPNTAGVVQMSPDLGNGILSVLAGNKLTATGSATETITGYVFGTEE